MTPKGWHSRGYLPHFDSPETTQFVTFRLFDSLPERALAQMKLKDGPVSDADRDAFLDQGFGACWLRRPEIAQIVGEALLHFDGERYRLMAWTIMPNHVHLLIETIIGTPTSATTDISNRRSTTSNNPVKAGLVTEPEDWPWGHARFRKV